MTGEELRQYLDNPGVFIPGFRAHDLLNQAETPRPMRMLMMDITDSFFDVNLIKEFSGLIVPFLKKNIGKLEDVRIATFVF